MLEKRLLDSVFSKLRHGAIDVTFWDGRTKRYGRGRPWVAIAFRDPGIVRQMRKSLDLAVGEGYMDGRIEVDGDPAQLGRLGDANRRELAQFLPLTVRQVLKRRRRSRQAEAADVQHHYDLGNDFYKLWLDQSLTYSCAYFKKTSDSLEQAQRQKIDHLLRKLQLRRGQTLLDIGSGWGSLILRAAQRYGVKAHGLTVSRQQFKKTKERIKQAGLSRRVSVELKHYDALTNRRRYDRVVSVGMYEHVGQSNHAKYMAAIDRTLEPGGLSLLHTITQVLDRPTSPWTDKYVFPGGYIPTLGSIIKLLPDYDFHTLDVESLRRHYAMTLDEWHRRFTKHEDAVTAMYDERFVRMWRLYLRTSYAAFQWGNLDLHQIVWSKGLTDALPLTRQALYR